MSYSKIKNAIDYYGIDVVRGFKEDFVDGLSIIDAAANLYIDNPEDSFVGPTTDMDEWINECFNGEPEEAEDCIQSYNGWFFVVEEGPCSAW